VPSDGDIEIVGLKISAGRLYAYGNLRGSVQPVSGPRVPRNSIIVNAGVWISYVYQFNLISGAINWGGAYSSPASASSAPLYDLKITDLEIPAVNTSFFQAVISFNGTQAQK